MKTIKKKNVEDSSLQSKFKEFEIKNSKYINGGKDGNVERPTNGGTDRPK